MVSPSITIDGMAVFGPRTFFRGGRISLAPHKKIKKNRWSDRVPLEGLLKTISVASQTGSHCINRVFDSRKKEEREYEMGIQGSVGIIIL